MSTGWPLAVPKGCFVMVGGDGAALDEPAPARPNTAVSSAVVVSARIRRARLEPEITPCMGSLTLPDCVTGFGGRRTCDEATLPSAARAANAPGPVRYF